MQSKDDVTIDEKGEIIEMPSKNKKCPCKSKKNYKNCECFNKDAQRRTEFINKLTKKIESGKPVTPNILML